MVSLKKNIKGFTIVETLIVLAVVGAIMLIVFLAVPALQRNSRNTSLKNDASNVLAAIAEFAAINNGKLPATAAEVCNGTIIIDNGTTAQETSANIRNETCVTQTVVLSTGTLAWPTASGKIYIGVNAKCAVESAGPPVTHATDAAPYTSRAISAEFLVETASGTAKQCIDG